MSLDPISAALDLGGEILKRVIPDPALRATAQIALETLHQSGELAQLTASVDLAKAQLAVNQTEAAGESIFKKRLAAVHRLGLRRGLHDELHRRGAADLARPVVRGNRRIPDLRRRLSCCRKQ